MTGKVQARRSRRTGTQTVERSFRMLKEIATANKRGVTLPQVSQSLALHRTTAYRLLQCLVREGAVRHDPTERRYFLGPLTLELAAAVRPQLELKAALSAAVQRIAQETGDTTFLIVRSGYDGVCMDRRLGSYPIKTIVVEIGTRRPLGIGAGSLAILSALPESEIESIVERNAARLRAYRRTRSALIKSARVARKAGYAAGPVYAVEGAIAVGVPVFDPEGAPIAGLSVAAITPRMTRARQRAAVEILKREATQMTHRMRGSDVVLEDA